MQVLIIQANALLCGCACTGYAKSYNSTSPHFSGLNLSINTTMKKSTPLPTETTGKVVYTKEDAKKAIKDNPGKAVILIKSAAKTYANDTLGR